MTTDLKEAMIELQGEYTQNFALLRRDDFRRVFQKILDTLPPVRITTIAKALGETDDFVKRRIVRLHQQGFGFGAGFEQQKTGLATLVVHVKKHFITDPKTRIKGLPENLKWVLRWQANTFSPKPMGILGFYVPIGRDYSSDFERILSRTYEILDMYETDITVYGKPDFSLMKIDPYGNVKTLWENISQIILNIYKKGEAPKVKRSSPVSLDLLDILILAALQRDAFITIKDLSKIIGTTISKIHRHLNHHLIDTGVITGTRLRIMPRLNPSSKLFLYIHGKTDPEIINLITHVMSRVLEFRAAIFNSRTGEYNIHLLVDNDAIGNLALMLENISRLLGEYEVHIVSRDTIKAYTIPFLAFHREEKGWSLDTQVMEIMRNKLNDLLLNA